VALAGQKLALSFKPATQDDEQTLASFLPEPDENGDINPEDIPDALPGYLINLTGEFSIGNAVAATASQSQAMGTELHSEMGYWQPGRGWQTSRNYPIAGEYRAVALDLQGISAAQAQVLQTDLAATQAKLEAADYTDLTKQQLVGDLLYSTILSYFALNNVQDRIAERQANSVGYRSPSYGLFKTSLTPRYWYGIPQSVKADGLGMDVDRFINQRVDRHNNTQNWIAFNRAQGARMSAMEHLVPEQMFSTEEAPAQGISTVKAIQLAAAEGQRIYTITQANLNVALQQIDLPQEIENEIRDAVGAGMEVITHARAVQGGFLNGIGVKIYNPGSGSGAYRIANGANGSEMGDYAYAAFGIIGTSVESGVTIIQAISFLLGAVDDVLKFVFKGNIFLGVILTMIDVFYKCGGKSTGQLVGMALFALFMFLLVALLATTFAPLWGILFSIVGTWLADQFMSFIFLMDPDCTE